MMPPLLSQWKFVLDSTSIHFANVAAHRVPLGDDVLRIRGLSRRLQD